MCCESPDQLSWSATSLVSCLGGPAGAPVGVTGRIHSTSSRTYAMYFPSGDHTGPSPSTRLVIVSYG